MREIDPGAQHADAYVNDYTVEQNQQFMAQFGHITQAMAGQLAAGTPVTDEAVADLIRQHYEFCLQFWTPTRDSYVSLALSYMLPSPYRDSYEAVAPGLGKYHYDAIVEWAKRNLD